MTILDFARKWKFVREVAGKQNRGQRVEAIQHWSGGDAAEGLSWCADWVTMMWDLWFEGKSPIDRTASCDTILEQARSKGLLRTSPLGGDMYLRLNSESDAHHVGLVTDISQWSQGILGTISGNTSPDGKSSNGDGVYEHDITIADRTSIIFVHAAGLV